MTLPTETLFPARYRLQDKLGQGGMGVVYRATDRLTGETIALKQVQVPAKLLTFMSLVGWARFLCPRGMLGVNYLDWFIGQMKTMAREQLILIGTMRSMQPSKECNPSSAPSATRLPRPKNSNFNYGFGVKNTLGDGLLSLNYYPERVSQASW